MTTLSADAPRAYTEGAFNDFPVIAADIIYQGAAVGDNGSGYARPLQAGDPFRGFADYKADNATGAAGDIAVRTRVRGVVKLSITSLAITDVGKAVFASDDNTFTLTEGSNSHVGRVVKWLETGVGLVEFDASKGSGGVLTALTDNSSGTASDTIAAITDNATKNAIASLAAKVNSLIAQHG